MDVRTGGGRGGSRAALRLLPGLAASWVPMRRWATRAAPIPVGALAAAAVPGMLGASALLTAELGMVFAIAAYSVVVITGWTGEISLAQVGFMGIGAFTMARLASPQVAAPLLLSLGVGVVAAAVAGLLVGLVGARLRGVYLTVLSLAVAQALAGAAFNNRILTGSANGVLVTRPALGPIDLASDRLRFQLLVGIVVVVGILLAARRASTTGRRMRTLRTAAPVVAARGIDADASMLAAMTLSAALAGLAGCLLGVVVGSVGPASFTPLQAALLLGLVVICGARSLSGAVIAGVLYAALPELLQRVLGDSTSAARSTTLVAGVALLGVVVARERLRDPAAALTAAVQRVMTTGDRHAAR